MRETDTYLSGSNPPRRKTSPKFANQYSPWRRYHDDMEPNESDLGAVGAFRTNATPAQAVFVDVNRDGMLDCFLQNGEIPREGNSFEWKLILGSTNGWNVATGPVTSGPETIPPVVRAGTNDFYRIWLSESDFYVDVFTCGDGSVGSIRSPLAHANRPPPETRYQAGGFPIMYSWYEAWFPDIPPNMPRDFYQLFELGTPMMQLERICPIVLPTRF